MPEEGLKIVIGSDVNSAISGNNKLLRSFSDVEKQLADTLASGEDFAKGLDDIVKQGNIAGGVINFLGKEISDFKQAFANATTTEDIQKFGAALQILQDKQNQLIQSGLKGGASIEEIGHAASSSSIGANKLRSSFFGLSSVFDLLPKELQHVTHGFDNVIESFEKITHGTEGAGDKVLKFAGVLGEVGLGLAISVAVGLLVDLGKELFTAGDAFSKAEIDAAKFKQELEEVDGQIKLLSKNTELATQIAKLRAQIKLGTGTEANILGDKTEIDNNVKLIDRIDEELGDLQKRFGALISAAPFQKLGEGAKQLLEESSLVAGVPELFPKDLVAKLKDHDKEFIGQIEATNKIIHDLQTQREDLQNKNKLVELQIDLERVKETQKANKKLQELFNSRAEIIKEFTAKFASIKDPFPDFFSKNLPLGKVEDKALRGALENAFKLLETASRDLFNTKRIDPGTIPIEIHFKPEIVGKSDLVREIEDKFGEISKEIEAGINKGVIEVPIDFKSPDEGDGKALKIFEDRRKKLEDTIEGLTGQKKAIMDFGFDQNLLTDSKVKDILKQVEHILNTGSANTPLKVAVGADFKVVPEVDTEQLQQNLDKAIAAALEQFLFDSLDAIGDTIGTAIGDVLSGNDISDAFKGLLTTLSDALGQLGKALIKAGVIATGIGKAIAAIGHGNPALAIGLGIALVALSQALKNNLSARASGGPVNEGQTYLVNEQGSEMFQPYGGQPQMISGGKQLFTPPVPGRILPAHLAKQIAMKMKLPMLEGGGAITGPTFSLIGEGFGISASNPEVVAPFASLKNLLSVTNNDQAQEKELRIRGNDLVLSNARTRRGQGRTQGR